MNRESTSEMLKELNRLIGPNVFVEVVMQKKPKDQPPYAANTYDIIFRCNGHNHKINFTFSAYDRRDISAQQIADLYNYVITNMESIQIKLKIYGTKI